MDEKKRGIPPFVVFIVVYFLIILVLNLAAMSKSFCDFYTDNLFFISSATYSRLTGLFPFSVGEVLITVGILLVAVMLVLVIVLPFKRKNARYVKRFKMAAKFFIVTLLTVGLIMTLNCSILYNCSKLKVSSHAKEQYDAKDITKLRDFIVEKCLEYHDIIERDAKGNALYTDDVNEKIADSLRSLSDEYERLDGYYPHAKKMMGSFYMYQAGMSGVYFPFSMEANYNGYLSATNQPFTIAHELSHLKGFIYENEANYIAYRACIKCDDPLIAYSGYLGVLGYVDDDFFETVGLDEYVKHTRIPEEVWDDYYAYTDEVDEELIEKDDNSVVTSETVSEISDDIEDTYMTYYDATPNYNEVTKLLLDYYTDNPLQ